jgi:pimeloyl-ACP methyl ester carboxylesterase
MSASAAAVETSFAVATPDGQDLVGLHRRVPGARATAVLCHGINGNLRGRGLFDAFADAAEAAGVDTLRFDFRCHGYSSGAPEDLTLAGEALDLRAVVAQELSPERPAVVVGTSFGCAAAARLAADPGAHDVRGLVLWNPVIAYRAAFLSPRTPLGAMVVPTTEEPLRPGVVARIPSTPIVFSERLAQELEQAEREIPELIRGLPLPVLLVHGTRDSLVLYEQSAAFAATAANVELATIDGADHAFPDHRATVVERTLAWIEQRLAAG